MTPEDGRQAHEAHPPLNDRLRSEQEHAVAHDYDTLDHDLERLGISIARVPSEAGVVWRLTLPLGDRAEAWEPGNGGLVVPRELMDLVGGILDGKTLVPAPAVLREPGAARLAEMLKEQLQRLLAHDPGVRLGADPENLHQHRVAARRTRAALKTARRYLDPSWTRPMSELLRELAAVTGPVRDLDVLLDHVAAEAQMLPSDDQVGARGLHERLRRDHAHAQTQLVAALDGRAYRTLLGRLRFPPRIGPGVEAVPVDELARRQVRRLARRVERLGPDPAGPEIHRLRIALKRARYAAELAGPGGSATHRFLAAARTLQDVLGEHQDSVVAERLLRASAVRDEQTAVAFAAGRLAERQRARQERAAEQIPASWRRLRKRASKL